MLKKPIAADNFNFLQEEAYHPCSLSRDNSHGNVQCEITAEIKPDFEYFATINFEKKQPPKISLKKKSRQNDQDDLVNSLMGSGESTLGSEDSIDLNCEDDDDEDEYSDMEYYDSSYEYDDDDNSNPGIRYRR